MNVKNYKLYVVFIKNITAKYEESNGKLPHLFIPRKTAALVPEFAVEYLPSAELHP